MCALLNSTPLGVVIDSERLRKHRVEAGLRIGEGRSVDFLRYLAWLVTNRHAYGDPNQLRAWLAKAASGEAPALVSELAAAGFRGPAGTTEAVAQFFSVSVHVVRTYWLANGMPRTKLSSRVYAYDLAEIGRWLYHRKHADDTHELKRRRLLAQTKRDEAIAAEKSLETVPREEHEARVLAVLNFLRDFLRALPTRVASYAPCEPTLESRVEQLVCELFDSLAAVSSSSEKTQ